MPIIATKARYLAPPLWTIAVAVCVYSVAGGQAQKHKLYRNKNYDYCIEADWNWSYQESFTRNGATFAPIDRTAFSTPPQITVGAYPDQPSDEADRPQTLDENIQAGISSIQKHAEGLKVTKQKEMTIEGLPARVIGLQYKDAKTGKEWFSEEMNVIDGEHVVYFVALKCHPKDAATLEPVFDEMVHSFRVQCGEKTQHR